MSTATVSAQQTFKLPTQPQRAVFVRREMRKQGLTIMDLLRETGLCWVTIVNYAGLSRTKEPTKDPHTNTTKRIFHALGFDLCFRARKKSLGMVEL